MQNHRSAALQLVKRQSQNGVSPRLAAWLSPVSITPTCPIGRVICRAAVCCFMLWAGILLCLLIWRSLGPPWWADFFERFFRVGSLVWGGGPVVLPLLLREVRGTFNQLIRSSTHAHPALGFISC